MVERFSNHLKAKKHFFVVFASGDDKRNLEVDNIDTAEYVPTGDYS